MGGGVKIASLLGSYFIHSESNLILGNKVFGDADTNLIQHESKFIPSESNFGVSKSNLIHSE